MHVQRHWIGADISVHLETAGWYADPRERYYGRYFDGQHWTARVCDKSLEQRVDPLGIAPSAAAIEEPISDDIQSAQRLAAYDQELIQQAHHRIDFTPSESKSRKGAPLTPRAAAERKTAIRAGALVASLLAVFAWWSVAGNDTDLGVVTNRDQPANAAPEPAPTFLSFVDQDTRRAPQSSAGDGTGPCVAARGVVEVRHPAPVIPGEYRIELCGGVLSFTSVAAGAVAAFDLVVGDAAVVLPDGVIVTWQSSSAGSSSAAQAAPSWDITYWGGADQQSNTVRVPAVIDTSGVARPPVPLPGGYVLSVPVDQPDDGEGLNERPAASPTPPIADA